MINEKDNQLVCGVCGKECKNYRSLGSHIRYNHKNLNSQEYYNRYLKDDIREGICSVCGKETKFINMNMGYLETCSRKCGYEIRKQTWIENFGVEHPSQSEEIKEKKRQTNIERFGVEHPLQSEEIKEKRKQTCIEKFGVEHPLQSKEVREKGKQTCIEKFGVEHPLQSEEIKEKRKQTNIERFGVEYASQSPEYLKTRYKNGKQYFFHNRPIYYPWAERLEIYSPESIEFRKYIATSKDGKKKFAFLQVKCKNCDKWFVPTRKQLETRYGSIIGTGQGENHMYCSDECKNSCSIFHQQNYRRGDNPNIDRPYQVEWANMIKERDGFECQICGSKENLVAHHIEPVKTDPQFQADIDNGITLCRTCHERAHMISGCGTNELARMIC